VRLFRTTAAELLGEQTGTTKAELDGEDIGFMAVALRGELKNLGVQATLVPGIRAEYGGL
jgi:hypothetical protein